MSRLTELLRQARKIDPQLGSDLEKEVAALMKRRTFGLVFEQHQPEAVELPGRVARRGDKVRVLPPRGELKQGDQRLWRVDRIERVGSSRIAHVSEIDADQPEQHSVPTEDVVVVAEFRDRIYPGLVETGRVERGGTEKPFHTVINAENHHALEMLTFTHRHSVDAIYIDPPYNTGAKDWKYNNNYVEGDDDYRHSKWLAFMERRLDIAKELLNPEESVLIVTIDEKEFLRLGLLLEQSFPGSRIQMVSSVTNPNGAARLGELTRVNEYIFFVFLGDARPELTTRTFRGVGEVTPSTEVRWERLMKGSNNALRADRPNLFYPVYVDPETWRITGVGSPLPLSQDRRSVEPPAGQAIVWPLSRTGVEKRWQVSADTLSGLVHSGLARIGSYDSKNKQWSVSYLNRGQIERWERGEFVEVGRDANGVVQLQAIGAVPKAATTIWDTRAHNAGEHGSRLLRALMPDRKFPFPKSLYAVEDTLALILSRKRKALVLDFFSGSGTTAHAVMRLNKQDGGHRQCISVTNNEVSADEQRDLRKKGLRPGDDDWESRGICEYITKPRVTAAITGRTPEGQPIKGNYKFTDEFPMMEGFEENAAFFTLTYEAPLSVRHNRAFQRVAPMLWMRAGSQGRIITSLGQEGWDVAESYGVLEDVDQLADFVARVSEVETVETVFVVTDSDAAFQMACRDLPDRVTTVRLYESYLHNFQINRRAGA